MERTSSPRHQPDAESDARVAPAPSATPRAVGRVLALQRSVGNRATAAAITRGAFLPGDGSALARAPLLERQPPSAAPALGHADTVRVQRDPIFNAITSGHAGDVTPMTPDEIAALNIDVGTELRRLAGNAVNRAAQQFSEGCNAVKKELEAAAKQQSELIALAVEIAVGFAAPGLATAIMSSNAVQAAAVRKLLVDTGKINNIREAGAAALANLDHLEKLRALGCGVNPGFADRLTGDNLKATFNAVSKSAQLTIKTVGPAKLAEPSADVVAALSSLVAAGAQDLDRSLTSKSEQELFSLILALDASVANASSYAAQIRRYLAQVAPIGSSHLSEFGGSTKRLVKMDAYGGIRLALIESGESGIVFGTSFNEFVSWISPSLEDSALSRAGLRLDQVPVFDPAKISNHIDAPTAANSRILP
jgi:hypothetical protein